MNDIDQRSVPADPAKSGALRRAWRHGFSHLWICLVSFPLVFLVALLVVAPPRDPGYLLMVWPWLVVMAFAGLVFGGAAIAMGALARRTLSGPQPPGEIWRWSRMIAVSVSIAYAASVLLLALG